MADASAPAAKPKFSWAAVAKAPAPPAPAPAAPAASDMDEEIIEAEELRSTAAGVAFFRADAAEPADDGAKTSERASGGAKPSFPALGAAAASLPMDEVRSIRVPQHRLTPLKESWEAIVKPVVDHMKLQIRMNTKARAVEIKVSRGGEKEREASVAARYVERCSGVCVGEDLWQCWRRSWGVHSFPLLSPPLSPLFSFRTAPSRQTSARFKRQKTLCVPSC